MNNPLPFFSVVIPTYNGHAQPNECLVSFAGLDYPRDRFEVIVVDDENAQSPEFIVARVRDRMRVDLIVQPHGGPARATRLARSIPLLSVRPCALGRTNFTIFSFLIFPGSGSRTGIGLILQTDSWAEALTQLNLRQSQARAGDD
jgi:cellulose synthase/poly-beta-1,6-N-acetylglucosamine synthase-like glycosyltransferase